MDRYHRQTLLPQFGPGAQARLGAARVLLVGCGALGSVSAEQLVRAGIGYLRLVDRDIVELTNLQRQVLFDEADARGGLPKAVAAAARLSAVNSSVTIEPVVGDFNPLNAEALSTDGGHVDLIVDGTDNVETRYLINDVSVKLGIAWVYGACVGTEGRVMLINPHLTPCLRCIFPIPPGAGELPTCDTAGVLASAAAIVASLQVTAAMQFLTRAESGLSCQLLSMDIWRGRLHSTSLQDARRVDCATCGRRDFRFLNHFAGAGSSTLCGRNAIQIRPALARAVDLQLIANRLTRVADVELTPYLLRFKTDEPAKLQVTLFGDGRAIVHGTVDQTVARAVYARWVGS